MNMSHVGYADIRITSSGTQRSAMQTDDDKLQITTTAGILKVYNFYPTSSFIATGVGYKNRSSC